MSSLADRLRGILPPSPATSARQGPATATSLRDGRGDTLRAGNAADILGGEWRDDFLVVERRYSPGYRHGRVAIADAAPPTEGWGRLHLLTASDVQVTSRYLFLDLETTGLAGGAGTYAFLVGLAWFDGCTFCVRQFFLSSFAAERVLLQAVRDIADETGAVVTYNGKSFDLPVLETRYIMNRMETPFAGLPHVDMLHPARRLWRTPGGDADGLLSRRPETVSAESDAGCRLIGLERTLCGHEREGDVPGFEIPARYFHYVRTGDARQLEPVLEHNRLDLLSLALLTARAAQLLDEGPATSQAAREALGLGQLYERAGLPVEARASFERATTLPADAVTRAEALRALAVARRRSRDYTAAAASWRALLELRGCPAGIMREATEALAVHHEHRLCDPLSARSFALKSLSMPVTPSRRDALEHRLARLNRKLGERGAEVAALF